MRATILLCLLAVPAFAQTPAVPTSPPPIPLPQWFAEIDTAKTGEVSRADFLKFRMKTFDQLDTNKDGKLSIEEFIKVVEPPFSTDSPAGQDLEQRRNGARAEFQNLDTNNDGFVGRPEAEALVHAEFNRYDTDRDNKITEPELRLIVQRALQRQEAERQQAEAQRRQGLMAINDLIDMQMRDADRLDKNNDGRISQQEYLVLAGPADGPQAQGLLPYEVRKQLLLRKFAEIDSNKDGVIDRVELMAYAVKEFLETDLNKDRFLTEEELKKAQEAAAAKTKALIPSLMPAAAPARPAPPRDTQPKPPPPPAPSGTR